MNEEKPNQSQKSVEEEIRDLEQYIKDQGGISSGTDESLPHDIRLQFLRDVVAYDKKINSAEGLQGIDLKSEIMNRISPPENPEEISNREIAQYLHSMIDLLARFHCQIWNTDHLSDRELYQKILSEITDEPLTIDPPGIGAFEQHDCCPCDDSDTWLRYYADESDREDWKESECGPLPPKESLKANRDDWIESLVSAYLEHPIPELTIAVDTDNANAEKKPRTSEA